MELSIKQTAIISTFLQILFWSALIAMIVLFAKKDKTNALICLGITCASGLLAYSKHSPLYG